MLQTSFLARCKWHWVIDQQGEYIPLEAKLTPKPTLSDAKHLKTFLNEYQDSKTGYVVCTTPRKIKLHNNIYAVPWQDLDELILK